MKHGIDFVDVGLGDWGVLVPLCSMVLQLMVQRTAIDLNHLVQLSVVNITMSS